MLFELVLGHLVGDYLLQNDWMALGKSKHNGLGWLTCFVHCVLYTLAVCAFTSFKPIWVVSVFLSHFILDKFGIPEKYLKLINGRSLQLFMDNPENQLYTPYIGLRAGFTTFVYVVVDNTMHMLLMYAAYRLIF